MLPTTLVQDSLSSIINSVVDATKDCPTVSDEARHHYEVKASPEEKAAYHTGFAAGRAAQHRASLCQGFALAVVGALLICLQLKGKE
ncbi:MAG: hypothetical protein KA754_05060 [Corallincola sp.]|nr:hypothetical protein [Corallincola sp.]